MGRQINPVRQLTQVVVYMGETPMPRMGCGGLHGRDAQCHEWVEEVFMGETPMPRVGREDLNRLSVQECAVLRFEIDRVDAVVISQYFRKN